MKYIKFPKKFSFSINIQNRQRGTKISIYGNLLKKKDLLDYRAIILTNALRKWGVLPPDKNICEMDEKQNKKFYHQIADPCE